MASSGQVSFILHRPRSMDNVGAVARIVKNFGLGRLWLVDPLSYTLDRALKLAVGAENVVEGIFVEKDLQTALTEFTFSVGTSSRGIRGRPSLSPAEVAERVAHAGGSCAVVFGDEKRGLSDEDLGKCQEVCRIPSDDSQPSLNLAQACAVMGYELFRHGGRASGPARSATHGELQELRERLRVVLDSADFLNPQNPERILGELMRPLERAGLNARELELWGNALRKLGAALGRR